MSKTLRDFALERSHAESVDVALQVLTTLGFSLQERAEILGYTDSVGDNPAYVEGQLKSCMGDRIAERCDITIGINALLYKIGCNTPELRRDLVAQTRYEAFNGQTLKNWLKGGDYVRLEYAFYQLRCMST